MLINTVTGDQEELTCFERDSDTEAFYSCFINWKNQLFIFGGQTNKRQISRLTGHRLKRVGHLQGGSKIFELKTYDICEKMSKTFEIFEINDFDQSAKTFEVFSL